MPLLSQVIEENKGSSVVCITEDGSFIVINNKGELFPFFSGGMFPPPPLKEILLDINKDDNPYHSIEFREQPVTIKGL